MAGKHEPSTKTSFYISLATSTLRALVIAGAVVIGAVVLSKGFAETPNKALGGGGTTAVHTTPPGTTPSTHPPSTRPPTTPKSPPIKGVTVQIYNGAGTAHLASSQQTKLQTAGYQVLGIGNAPHSATTIIYYVSTAKAAADYLKTNFYPNATEQPAPSQYRTSKLTVILGADFSATP